MATLCTNCGQALPREDARFCNSCGTSNSPGSFSLPSPSSSEGSPTPSPEHPHNNNAIREQVAQQPPFRPPRRPQQNNRPVEISPIDIALPRQLPPEEVDLVQEEKVLPQSEKRNHQLPAEDSEAFFSREEGTDDEVPQPLWSPISDSNATWSEPLPPPTAQEEKSSEGVKLVQEEALRPSGGIGSIVPSYRVEAGAAGSGGGTLAVAGGGGLFPPQGRRPQEEALPDEIEAQQMAELPTIASPSIRPEQIASIYKAQQMAELSTIVSPSIYPEQEAPVKPINKAQQMAELPTIASPSVHPEQAVPVAPVTKKSNSPSDHGRNPTSMPSFSQPTIQATHKASPPIPGLQEQNRNQQLRILAPTRSKSRTPLLIALVLLSLLVLGGLVASLFVFQPFSIPQVTQPHLRFLDSKLGMSLSYPNGWIQQLDAGNGIARFSDSSHTAQFSIMAVAADSQNTNLYTLEEIMQLGITGAKPGNPLSFAGTSWQQTQGNLQQNGVNYTVTLLTTTHNNHLYSLVQQAPQATYTEEEQVIFSPMRASFRFLS